VKRSLLAAGLLLAARAALVAAQVVDTTRADSLARDTTDYTAQFLKAQQDARRLIPVAPRIGAGALLPLGTRFVFNRDSIAWHNAETVSDLLTKVPGVFLLRGGWVGRPELPTYHGRGATSVDYVVDGVPYYPMGQDSVSVDPSMLPMGFLDRVEIERLPGHLRVYLFTHRHDRSVPYSRIGIASGDLSIARYQGALEKRSSRGIGFAAAFDHLSVPAQQGVSGDYSNTQARLRLEYVPSARFAAELQYLLSSPDREPVLGDPAPRDTLSRARHGSRGDLTARVFLARRADGLGPRLDLIASRTNWVDEIEKDSTQAVINGLEVDGVLVSADTVFVTRRHQRALSQVGALLAYRLPAASLEGSVFYRSAWTPLEVRARGGVAPSRWLTASLEGVYSRHDGGRNSEWLTARAGVALPFGLSAGAVYRRGSEVSLPAILTDPAQKLDDRSLLATWRRGFAEIEATYSSTAGYRPTGFAQYPHLTTIAPSGRTQWISVNARIAPRQWLILDGWYSTPQGTRPEGQPPTHSVINGTIQSKFLPTFKSGIFNLKLQFSVENWGTGVLARDTAGTAIVLKGATHMRYYIGLQIGAFQAYYNRYNVAGARLPYVPDSNPSRGGLGPPRFASTFGVRWEFSN
jgi:hypothetical protein